MMNLKEFEFQTKRVIHLAKRFIDTTACRGCGEKKRKVVCLHEFGDPHLPSQVIIYCPKCHRNDTFAMRPHDEAIAFAKKEQTGDTTAVVDSPIYKAEDMIEYAIRWNRYKKDNKLKNGEFENAIKDKDNKIIASPEQVKKIDAKKKK
jgi:Zn ribbon nucleic-acid-binding protein